MGNCVSSGILFAGMCVLFVGPAGGGQKTSVSGSRTDVAVETRQFKENLARLEKEYESELATRSNLRDQGAMTDAEVDEARLGLARVRINQAAIEKQPDTIRVHLKTVIEIRDRQYERMQSLQRMAGVGLSDLLAAQRRLAYARFLLARQEGKKDDATGELREIARICDDELKVMTAMGGGEAGSVMERARYRLAFARYCLARLEGRAEDAVREMRTAAANWESYLDRQSRLPRTSILPSEEELIQLQIQIDRYRLAVAEQKPEEIRKLLRETIAICETFEKRLRVDPAAFSKLEKSKWYHNLALTRYFLTMAEAGVELPDDPWRLLEW